MTSTFKQSLLAAAVAAAVLPTAAFAQSAPSVTLYGTFEMALEANSDGTTNRTAIQNFSSNFGIKGEKQINADVAGIFQMETGFAADDTSQSKTLANRNSFVGVKSKSLGQLIMGTHDMPLKDLKGMVKIALGEGDVMETIIHGRGSNQSASASIIPPGGIAGTGAFGQVHTRKTNVLLYTSPKFSNTVVKFAYSPDEAAKAATGVVPAYSQAMTGASVEYNDNTWNAGLAYQSQDNVIAPNGTTISGYSVQASKAIFGVTMGQFRAGLSFSNIDNGAGKKTNNWMVSGAYTMGPMVFKLNHGASSETFSGAADDLTMSSVEFDYALEKSMILFVSYSQINNSKNGKSYFSQSDNFPAPTVGKNPTALNLGVQYKF